MKLFTLRVSGIALLICSVTAVGVYPQNGNGQMGNGQIGNGGQQGGNNNGQAGQQGEFHNGQVGQQGDFQNGQAGQQGEFHNGQAGQQGDFQNGQGGQQGDQGQQGGNQMGQFGGNQNQFVPPRPIVNPRPMPIQVRHIAPPQKPYQVPRPGKGADPRWRSQTLPPLQSWVR